MSAPLVYFAHGKESGPWGTKIQRLAECAQAKGFTVESPDYSDISNPDERVNKLLALTAATNGKLVLVGSSMGGYVSAAASEKIKPDGLFLLAPAVLIQGFGRYVLSPNANFKTIVHGWQDELIPVANVFEFAQSHEFELHLVNSDHRLISKLDEIAELFERFLVRVLAQ